ncbi:MAG: hypothetical protein APF76_06190 [Desulfitibacter sp. BRH_c19]|nr:MAG: hypothetical protein APF76_06190 [Desulfitibacter sp. BRH_c19]
MEGFTLAYYIRDTKENLRKNDILNLFATATPYGDKIKENLAPYPADKEELLKQEFEELKAAITYLKEVPKSRFEEIKDSLMQIVSVDLVIEYLEGKAILNSPMLFNLNKFLFIAKRVADLMENTSWFSNTQIRWQFNEKLYKLLKIKASYSFYIGSYGDEAYEQFIFNLRKLEVELSNLIKNEENRLLKYYALEGRVFIDGALLVNKNSEELVSELAGSDAFIVTKETFTAVTFSRKEIKQEILLKEKIDELKSVLQAKENQLYENLSDEIREHSSYIRELTEKVGKFDWLLAKAVYAVNHSATIPVINSHEYIFKVHDGVHPIIKKELQGLGKEFSPLTIKLESGVAVLTGANMGGKTITLKTVGALLIMAQMGLPVTARYFEFKPADFIYTSLNEEKDLVGLSSFGAEVQSLNEVIELKNMWGLILLDEIANGTNPEEGIALAKAILNTLMKGKCSVLVTTHFDGLSSEKGVVHWQVKGLRKLKDIVSIGDIYANFDYGLEKVTAKDTVPKDALKVAYLMGMNKEVLLLAEKYLVTNGEE